MVLMMGNEGLHKLSKVCVSIKESVISYVIKSNELCSKVVPKTKKDPVLASPKNIKTIGTKHIATNDDSNLIKVFQEDMEA